MRHGFCFVALLIVAFYFCWPTLFSGKSLVGGDTVEWRAVAQSMIEYREETGEEPLWASNVFAGMPGYIISNSAPVLQIDELPKILREISWPFSHVIFMLIGGYLLVWYLTCDTLSSLLAACAYAMTTYLPVILIAGHNTKFVALAYVPWLLLAFIYAMRQPGMLSGLLFAIALSVNLRAGHVQITYYVTFMILIWWAVLFLGARRRKNLSEFFKATGILAASCVLALLMVAEYYWPTLEYKEYSIRGTSANSDQGGGLSWTYAMRWSQSPGELLTMLIPNAYGGSGNVYWGPKPFTAGPHYAGCITVLLAVLALLRIRSSLAVALGISGGLMVLFSLGRHFELLNRTMFEYFPLFSAFRAPETWLIIVMLILAVLAALGLSYTVRREVSAAAERAKWQVIYTVFGIIGGGVLFFAMAGNTLFDFQRAGERDQVIAYVAQSTQRSPSDRQVMATAERLLSEKVIAPRKDALLSDAKRSFFFLILAGLAFLATQRRWLPGWLLQIILSLLVVLDLGGVANRYLNTDNLRVSRYSAQHIQTLDVDRYVLGQEGQFRVLSLERMDQTGLARPSFHHESLGGYSAAKLRLYQDFLDNLLFDSDTGLPNENMLDMMNVRYIFSPSPIPGALDVEYGPESGLTVYENLDVLPRAYFVGEVEVQEDAEKAMQILRESNFDPALRAVLSAPIEEEVIPIDSSSIVSAHLRSHGARRIVYDVETDAPRLLVLSEVYYPAGWRATLNGNQVPIYRANYLLRAVTVPEGKHTLEMTFNPESYVWGKKISLIATILVYGLTILQIGLYAYGYVRNMRG